MQGWLSQACNYGSAGEAIAEAQNHREILLMRELNASIHLGRHHPTLI
jgi:hypothetical protein